VEAAIGRINGGTFGECLHCGQDISVNRLIAVPCTTCHELWIRGEGIARLCRTYGALFLFNPFPALTPSAREARLGPHWANL
jgi:hypothetical protein